MNTNQALDTLAKSNLEILVSSHDAIKLGEILGGYVAFRDIFDETVFWYNNLKDETSICGLPIKYYTVVPWGKYERLIGNGPEWGDAPTWANWKAQDADGTWFWYGEMPVIAVHNNGWDINDPETFLVTEACKGEPNSDWRYAILSRSS